MRKTGVAALVLLLLLVAGWFAASRLGYLETLQQRLQVRPPPSLRLSAGDFPAGVSAPVGELASLPLRPTRIGFTPRGSSAALLVATGGALLPEEPDRPGDGLLKSAYAFDARAIVYLSEEDVRLALARGGEAGGVDMAAISVDRVAAWAVGLRDAAPRTVLLLGRSQGQEALAAVGLQKMSELAGKRLGVNPRGGAFYFALFLLSRSGLSLADVTLVELKSSLEAGAVLREGRADAVVGLRGDVELAARDRGGQILATSADSPHLLATVLVVRGDFAARYPDAVRRVLRGLLDAGGTLATSERGARLLGEIAPYLGDPAEAIKSAPAASLQDNLAFFGLSGESPVTYDELYQSAAALFLKMGKTAPPPHAEDTRELGALKYVAEARGP